ncbi:cleavage and polyadenylation specific factor 5 [Paecilomyces variotii No. 5]|uniref:Cleavage and polyadenylation specific factor 5 n=1 Tax=Byssochlamys spectabilis (strain No. 5 / NBRC 109023) TaxID=1356009 RepID=V5FR36_BYSSN|nr:cleavage and polyadenylation specific factor 5 [Paecilomyces variotii No. 5]
MKADIQLVINYYSPTLPKSFDAKQPETIRLYPLSNYTFGTKETQPEEDPSVLARLKRLEEHYDKYGMRRTCEGVLVCHEHNHPHVLMLQIANAFFKLYVPYPDSRLRPSALHARAIAGRQLLMITTRPGDYLHHNDDEVEGFKSRLNERLAPVGSQFSGEGVNEEWEIGDTLAQWWRPNFETFMYPFLPGHVTRPKECKKLYFIQLPKKKVLSVPKNMKLLAVPLFELYDNTARYGPQLSAIPHLLSRYNFEFVDENDNVVAVTPGTPLPEGLQIPQTKVLAGGDGPGDGQDTGMEDYTGSGENGGQAGHPVMMAKALFLVSLAPGGILLTGASSVTCQMRLSLGTS